MSAKAILGAIGVHSGVCSLLWHSLRSPAVDTVLKEPEPLDIVILDYSHLMFHLMYSYFMMLSTNNEPDSCQKIIYNKRHKLKQVNNRFTDAFGVTYEKLERYRED